MSRYILHIIIGLLIGLSEVSAATNSSQPNTAKDSGNIEHLVEWMTGYFSSAKQADTSSDRYHVDVRLHMQRIWSDNTDGYWLYVEQAYADDTLNPYRQRIYHIFTQKGEIRDRVYKINNDSLYIRGWKTPEQFDRLNKNDLILKNSCGLVFQWKQKTGAFHAKTSGNDCKAGIPGVNYITSESKIFPHKFTSWDLGYNEDGEIVMGPDSPYIFDKIKNYSLKNENAFNASKK